MKALINLRHRGVHRCRAIPAGRVEGLVVPTQAAPTSGAGDKQGDKSGGKTK